MLTPDSIIIEDQVISLDRETRNQQTANTTIGKLVTYKTPNKNAVKNLIIKAWGNPEGVNIVDMGPNLFLFKLKEKK